MSQKKMSPSMECSMLRSMLCMIALLLLLVSPALAETVKVSPGQAVIQTPKDADDMTRLAAAELAKHLTLITGKEVKIQEATEKTINAYIFHVGQAPESDGVPFASEEARWRITPQGAWFYGEGRGVQFAVYDFLESQLSVRWIEPGDRGIAYTPMDTLELQEAYTSWQPRFMFRKIRQGARLMKEQRKVPANLEEFASFNKTLAEHNAYAEDEVLWQYRMRMGGQRPGGAHAFSQWWKKYGQSHPEYFALTEEGNRKPVMLANRTAENSYEWVKICPSNPGVARQLIEDWLPRKEVIRYVSTGPNDGIEHFCQCEQCLALDARLPGEKFTDHLTDRYVHLTSEVARMARQHRPDAMASMYAYLTTLQPPRKTKVEPNVVVHIVPYLDPLELEHNRKLFEGWRDAGATTFTFRPNYHFKYASTPMPLGFEKQMFDIFQQAVHYGAISFDYDSLLQRWPADGLMNYILAKAMADPLKPFDYWMDHYTSAYGPAAGEVKDYYRYWREEIWEKRLLPDIQSLGDRGGAGSFDRGLMWSLGEYYRPEDFDKADAILKRGMSRDLTDLQRKKLRELQLTNEHARLTYDAVVAKNIAKRQPALKLLAFRKEHRKDLNFNWLGIIGNEVVLGDITGTKLAQTADDYLDPWQPTDDTWQFKLDPQNVGQQEAWYKLDWSRLTQWEQIATTAFWENQARLPSLSPDTQKQLEAKYDGIGWYATRITIPDAFKGKAIYLRFGAVDESAWIYLNGKEVGQRIYSQPNDWKTPFEIRIDPHISWNSQPQTLIVRVEDKAGVGGIWKPVWIVTKKSNE